MFLSISVFGMRRGGRAALFDIIEHDSVVSSPVMKKMRSMYSPWTHGIGRVLFHNMLLLRFKEAGHA
jgi:hypothetical protein